MPAAQRTFDRKSLGVGVCFMCGHVLWSSVDGAHTFLVNKPRNMTKDDAPASAYLRAVPNCTLTFQYSERGNSTKERWYCCSHCKAATVPTEMHVGHVFGESESDVRLVMDNSLKRCPHSTTTSCPPQPRPPTSPFTLNMEE